MDIKHLLKEKREDILRIARQHGAYNVRIFGSVARDESDSESDVDFSGTTLLKYTALLRELQKLLDCNVDIVSEAGIRKTMRDQVMREAVAL